MRVVDTIGGNGPVLASLTADGLAAVRQQFGAKLRILPSVQYERPNPGVVIRNLVARAITPAEGPLAGLRVVVRDNRQGRRWTSVGSSPFHALRQSRGRCGLDRPWTAR